MSYDPQSGGSTEPTGSGETKPTGDSMNTEPVGGQPTQPTGDYPPAGGYAPPTPPGGYTPPSSDYTPPPAGGYTPPPSGGYTPPPAPGAYTQPTGGYTPPPQGGGYGPPPGGPPQGGPPPGGGYGGYSPPPPPPPMGGSGGPTFNMGSMGTINQAQMQGLVQKYINIITKPSAAAYEAEIPQANWQTVIIGVVAVAVISAIVALIRGFLFPVSFSTYGLNSSAATSAMTSVAAATGFGGAIISLILYPVIFFAGSGIQYMMGRLFGGTGSNYMTQSYLLSLSYTPLRIIGSVIGIIPIVGSLVAFAAILYQIYHAGLVLQASQRLQPGRAQLAAFIPLIAVAVLLCACAILAGVFVAAAINGSR